MQQTTVSLSPKHDASGQPAPKGTPRVHNPGDADGSEAPPRAATGALSAVKRITWQSIRDTVRDRWRYVVGVFVGMCIIAAALMWFVGQAPRTSVELALAGLAAAVAATLLLVGALDVSSWRVRQITAAIEQIAGGDLDARVPARGPGGVGALSHAVNSMAERLQRQSRKRNRERDRLHTVLHVMDDGVIILNKHGYVSVFNLAATRILNVAGADALNKSFVQVVRDYRVAEIWLACIKEGGEQSATLELANDAYVRVAAPRKKGVTTTRT